MSIDNEHIPRPHSAGRLVPPRRPPRTAVGTLDLPPRRPSARRAPGTPRWQRALMFAVKSVRDVIRRFTRHFVFMIALLPGSVTRLGAQGSSPAPDARLLQLRTDTLAIVVAVEGQSRRSGTVVDRLDTIRVGGQRAIRRIYATTDAVLGNRVDTIVDFFDALRPYATRSRSGQGTELLDWDGGRVHGTVTEPDKTSRSVDETLPGTVYGAATVDLVLRSSPLAEGYSVRIDCYSGLQGRVQVTARVGASEIVDGADTWRIDAQFGEINVSFWVAKSSRRLVRQVMHIAPGAELRFELRR